MSIPNGYTKIEANKLYENVEYYIDTSVAPPSNALVSNITTFPYIGYGGYEVTMGLRIDYYSAIIYDGGYIALSNNAPTSEDDVQNWLSDNITNGIVTGYPTLNINLTTSPDWLYVKTAPDYSKVKKVNITDMDGNEFSFDIGGGGVPYFEDNGGGCYFYNADTSQTYTMYLGAKEYYAVFTHNGTTWVLGDNTNYPTSSGVFTWEAHEDYFGFYGQDGDSGGSYVDFEVSDVYCVSSSNSITTYNCTESWTFYYCFAEGTQILLADGTTKAVENITYDDVLQTWDFDNQDFGSRKPCWIAKEAVAPCYWRVELSNGAVLKLVGAKGKCHRLYNATQGKFLYPQDFNTGDITFVEGSEDAVTIVSCKKVCETVKYYNLATEHDINCFAEGVLTGNRFCNIYPIKNMQYVKDIRQLANREDYAEIPDKLFYGLRLAEQPVQDDKPDNVNYYHTMKEHILHNVVEHERDYQGEADYKKWIF